MDDSHDIVIRKEKTMEEEMISADEFFGDFDKQEQVPLVRVSDHQESGRGRAAFENVKVKMVMKIEGCGREEALRIIAERSAELRPKENAQRNAHDFNFIK